MCCDGVFDALNSREIAMMSRAVMGDTSLVNDTHASNSGANIVGRGGTMKLARTIVRLSGALGSADNCTAIAMRF